MQAGSCDSSIIDRQDTQQDYEELLRAEHALKSLQVMMYKLRWVLLIAMDCALLLRLHIA